MIPRLGDLILFPDQSIGYVYKSESKKIGKINHISLEIQLPNDTLYLKKSWLPFYMATYRTCSDFHNGFVAERSNFSIQKFANKVMITATHRSFNECCRLSGWEVVKRAKHHMMNQDDKDNLPSSMNDI